MRNKPLIKKIFFFLLVPFCLQAQYQNGGYIGSIDINAEHKVIILNALPSDKFEVYLPAEKNHWQLNQNSISIKKGERFIIKSAKDSVTFIIKSVDSSGFKGDAVSKNTNGSFTFLKIKPLNYDLNKQLAGSYQIAKDEIIDLGPMDEMSGTLVYLNSKTLRTGVLLPVSKTKFISGRSLGIPYPVNDVVTFIGNKNNQPAGLTWLDKTGKKITTKKIAPYSREEVKVMNDSVTLKGDLLIPLNGKQQHPAVIFAHGSGDAKRNIGFWNIFFVRLGFAVLSFDKRGVGGSTNDWFTSTLDEIAGDWLKGLDYLKTRKEIDSKRIGVHGSSQGGWTTPIMAANNKDVAFIIVRVGSGQNVATTMAHEIGWMVREEGFTAAQQIEAQKNAEDVFNLVINNSTWDKAKAILEYGAKQP